MLNARVGDKFQLADGHFAELIMADNYKVILEDVDNKASALPFEIDEFSKALECDDISPVLDITPQPKFTEFQTKARDERLKYIHTLSEMVHEHGVKATSKDTYPKLIKQVEKRYPETQSINPKTLKKQHPGHTTIARYWKAWVNNNYDDNALVTKLRDCPKRIDHHSEVFMNTFISNTWLQGKSEHIKGHYTAYKYAVKEARDDTLYVVSERTFRRRVGELRAFEKRFNNAGKAERNQLLLTYTQKYRQQYALERVEVDRCSLNLCLIDDETKEATDKVSLLIALDCYSRMPLSVVVEVGEGENKENVSNLFQHMFLHDNRLIAFGKPVNIIADNGSGFNNGAIQAIAERLGTTITYAPALKPQMKPFVESFIGTMRKRFFEGWVLIDEDGQEHIDIPGYFGKRQANSYGINLKKKARLTVSQFKKQLHQFLLEYCHDVHSQTKQKPAEAWNTSLKVHHQANYQKLLDYDDVSHAFHVFAKQDTHKLQPRGLVTLHNQTFGSHELKQLYIDLQLHKDKNVTPEVVVRYNPFDARSVSVTATIPGSQVCREVRAKNLDFDILPERISFDELNGYKPKSFGIYGCNESPLSGAFIGHIDKLKKPRGGSNSNNSGKRPASFEQNNEKALPAESRITLSNQSESKVDLIIEANTPLTRAQKELEKKAKNSSNESQQTQNTKSKAGKRHKRGNALW